jgi:Skp family chaperone for outer membrane proteins
MTRFHSTIRSTAAFAAFILIAATASAQGTAEQRAACTGDAFQYCSAEIPNATRVEACLRKNMKKISAACRSQFRPQTARARTRPVAASETHRIH